MPVTVAVAFALLVGSIVTPATAAAPDPITKSMANFPAVTPAALSSWYEQFNTPEGEGCPNTGAHDIALSHRRTGERSVVAVVGETSTAPPLPDRLGYVLLLDQASGARINMLHFGSCTRISSVAFAPSDNSLVVGGQCVPGSPGSMPANKTNSNNVVATVVRMDQNGTVLMRYQWPHYLDSHTLPERGGLVVTDENLIVLVGSIYRAYQNAPQNKFVIRMSLDGTVEMAGQYEDGATDEAYTGKHRFDSDAVAQFPFSYTASAPRDLAVDPHDGSITFIGYVDIF